MVNLNLAIRSNGSLFLAAIFLIGFVIARVKVRQVQLHVKEIPNAAGLLFGYRIGSYLCALMLLVSLLAWVGLLFALRFNWDRNDVSEIEILRFSSSYPQTNVEQTVIVKDNPTLTRLFNGLKSLQPYTSQHEHAVGKSYILRLRRQSDGQWSSYRVKIYPDRESTGGGLYMKGVYVISFDVSVGRFNLGTYQSPELGRLVEELTHEKSAGVQP